MCRIETPHQRGLGPDRVRPLARTNAKRVDAAVEWNTQDRGLAALGRETVRHAHERRRRGEQVVRGCHDVCSLSQPCPDKKSNAASVWTFATEWISSTRT